MKTFFTVLFCAFLLSGEASTLIPIWQLPPTNQPSPGWNLLLSSSNGNFKITIQDFQKNTATNTIFETNLVTVLLADPNFINFLSTNPTLVSNVLFSATPLTTLTTVSNQSINIYDDIGAIPRYEKILTNTLGVTFNPVATVAPAWGTARAVGYASYWLHDNVPVSFTQTNKIIWFTTIPTTVTNGVISFSAWGNTVHAAYKELCAY